MFKNIINKISTCFYNGLLKYTIKNENKLAKSFAIIDKISKIYDSVVYAQVGDIFLYLNFSHKLPYYYSLFKKYDRALPRIAQMVKQIDGELVLIDIGANVGDTVSLVAHQVNGQFLCVEGEEHYLELLNKNISAIQNSSVVVENVFCSSKNQTENHSVKMANGTAKLVINKTSNQEKTTKLLSLDEIIARHENFKNTNLFKIDTDGFELNVLSGAEELLKNSSPILYFEFTPQAYIDNNQNPMDIIKLLVENGYENALFYDNFGNPMEIINLKDFSKVDELIAKIDNQKIYYYDILCLNNSNKDKYYTILEEEMHF